jgi:hypothetical protein
MHAARAVGNHDSASDRIAGAPRTGTNYFPLMIERTSIAARTLDHAVASYRAEADFAALLSAITALCNEAGADEIIEAVEPYIDMPEVAGPAYERVVDLRPDDARALVVLASSYWLTGRGPEVVGELASRALTADPANRGAWHLWALTETEPRRRMERWMQVSRRFADDDLARANLADNATSLASAENDPVALAVAIDSYEMLLASARHPDQREAIQKALETLRTWRV